MVWSNHADAESCCYDSIHGIALYMSARNPEDDSEESYTGQKDHGSSAGAFVRLAHNGALGCLFLYGDLLPIICWTCCYHDII